MMMPKAQHVFLALVALSAVLAQAPPAGGTDGEGQEQPPMPSEQSPMPSEQPSSDAAGSDQPCQQAAEDAMPEDLEGQRFAWNMTGLNSTVNFTEGAFAPENSSLVFVFPRDPRRSDRSQRKLRLVPAKIAYDYSNTTSPKAVLRGARGGPCIVLDTGLPATYEELINKLNAFNDSKSAFKVPEEKDAQRLVASVVEDPSQFSQAIRDMCSKDACGRDVEAVYYTLSPAPPSDAGSDQDAAPTAAPDQDAAPAAAPDQDAAPAAAADQDNTEDAPEERPAFFVILDTLVSITGLPRDERRGRQGGRRGGQGGRRGGQGGRRGGQGGRQSGDAEQQRGGDAEQQRGGDAERQSGNGGQKSGNGGQRGGQGSRNGGRRGRRDSGNGGERDGQEGGRGGPRRGNGGQPGGQEGGNGRREDGDARQEGGRGGPRRGNGGQPGGQEGENGRREDGDAGEEGGEEPGRTGRPPVSRRR